jgi:hypothetical protein
MEGVVMEEKTTSGKANGADGRGGAESAGAKKSIFAGK